MARKNAGAPAADRVLVENVIRPGSSRSVDGPKYRAMRHALLKVLPARAPGMTLAEALEAVKKRLPESQFPGGKSAGWWFMCVQLDLAAKRLITRTKASPLRIHRA